MAEKMMGTPMGTPRRKRRYKEDFINFGFSYILSGGLEKPLCVLCSEVLSEESMKPNKMKRHLQAKHPEFSNESPDFFKTTAELLKKARLESGSSVDWQSSAVGESPEFLKTTAEILKKARLDSSGSYEWQASAAVIASYAVSLQIARAKQTHTIGEELVLPCAKDIVYHILGEKASKSLELLAIAPTSVAQKIKEMSDDILSQIVAEMKAAPLGLFSLQVDESTDVTNLAQLLVYVRYINDGDFKDEFLFSRTLDPSTTALDVFDKVGNFLGEHSLKWESVGGICTDGASPLLGCQSGFQKMVKNVSPHAVGVHSTIHGQVLALKTLPENLKAILLSIVKAVNFLKACGQNSNLMATICQDMDSTHELLLLHTEVRWLSKGKVLQRIFSLKTEVAEFLFQQGKADLAFIFSDRLHLSRIAYIVDFFTILNAQISPRGKNTILLDFIEKLNAFQMKLDLWLSKVKNSNLYMFPTLNEFMEENAINVNLDGEFQHMLIQHLQTLKDELSRYFPSLPQIPSLLIRRPFAVTVELVPENCQEDFIDLINSDNAKIEFESLSLRQFWIKQLSKYPTLSEAVLRNIMPLPSVSMCETAFSSLLHLRSSLRNKLQIEDDLRCAVSQTSPQIEKLVMVKQYQPFQ